FAPSGFREEAFVPCYGLAEATLLVSGGATRTRPASAIVCSSDGIRASALRADELPRPLGTREDQATRGRAAGCSCFLVARHSAATSVDDDACTHRVRLGWPQRDRIGQDVGRLDAEHPLPRVLADVFHASRLLEPGIPYNEVFRPVGLDRNPSRS